MVSSMRVRVSDRALLHDLIRYLGEGGCIVEQASATMLNVFLPSTPDYQEARAELGDYLTAWRILNPGVDTKVFDFA